MEDSFRGDGSSFLRGSTGGMGSPGSSASRRVSLSALAGSNNSQALLEALRTLQERIRQKDTEKRFFEDKLREEKERAVELENQLRARMERIQVSADKNMNALRQERDSLFEERNHLATSLQTVKDQMEELERELRFVREEAENADTDRRMAEVKAKAAENASSEDSQRLRDVERRCQQAEQRVEINHMQVVRLQDLLREEQEQREEAEQQRDKLDAAMRELLSLNEALVNKLTSAEQSASGVAGGSVRKIKRKRRISSVSRRTSQEHNHSTAAQAHNTSAWSARSTPALSSSSRSVHNRLRKANQNEEIPFMNQVSLNSHNIHSAVQSSLDLTKSLGNRNRSPTPPRQAYSTTPGRSRVVTPSRQRPQSTERQADDILRHVKNQNLDVGDVLASLEVEYDELYQNYEELLRRAQSSSGMASDDLTVTSQLRDVISRLEAKGQQVRTLKEYRSSLRDRLQEALTPPRVRGAEKRLKALKLFHSLRNLDSEN